MNLDFQILSYGGTCVEDMEVTTLLYTVFVKEGYTQKSYAEKSFVPNEIQRRGKIKLARSNAGQLLGMAIFVPSSSSACQVAKKDEAEIQLLAVYPEVRGKGIGSRLILVCEQQAISCGYTKMVLSTQQTMKDAHHLYEQRGYIYNSKRNWTSDGNKIYFVYEKVLQI